MPPPEYIGMAHRFYNTLNEIQHNSLNSQFSAGSIYCSQCHQNHFLVSHGFTYKTDEHGQTFITGKRLVCSSRWRNGCGATMRLILATTLPKIHYGGLIVMTFVAALLTGHIVTKAYQKATGAHTHRNAWRWIDKLKTRLTLWRPSLFDQHEWPQTPIPQAQDEEPSKEVSIKGSPKTTPLLATLEKLLGQELTNKNAVESLAEIQQRFQTAFI